MRPEHPTAQQCLIATAVDRTDCIGLIQCLRSLGDSGHNTARLVDFEPIAARHNAVFAINE